MMMSSTSPSKQQTLQGLILSNNSLFTYQQKWDLLQVLYDQLHPIHLLLVKFRVERNLWKCDGHKVALMTVDSETEALISSVLDIPNNHILTFATPHQVVKHVGNILSTLQEQFNATHVGQDGVDVFTTTMYSLDSSYYRLWSCESLTNLSQDWLHWFDRKRYETSKYILQITLGRRSSLAWSNLCCLQEHVTLTFEFGGRLSFTQEDN